MLTLRLYLVQRISAMVMAPLVIGHIGLMIYASQGGLSASEILSRTQGSVWWALYYGAFVVAASVHASIGLRVIAFEYLKLSPRALGVLTGLLFLGLSLLGGRAVVAVIA